MQEAIKYFDGAVHINIDTEIIKLLTYIKIKILPPMQCEEKKLSFA